MSTLGYISRGKSFSYLDVGLFKTAQSTVTGLTTRLTALQDGTVIPIDPTAAVTVTLPTPAAGLSYRFNLVADAGDVFTVSSESANQLFGTTVEDTTGMTGFASQSNLLFSAAAVIGDYAEVYGVNSTTWLVQARSSAQALSTT